MSVALPPSSRTVRQLASDFLHQLWGNTPVRTRIAPSPTGTLHIGTARTALINYLFAKRHNGTFVLRIEDTDLERSKPEFEDDIIEHLRWLGILWDEGPGKEGRFGPYRQSERSASYRRYAKDLLRHEKAYYCFCTTETLEAEREAQKEAGESMIYPGTCRTIPLADAESRARAGERALLRLRMPEGEITFPDLIRGAISFQANQLGDIALAKVSLAGDELEFSPLYNFAVVIDDHEMAISHVLRGEDHISNTPKQIAIARALEIPLPQYGHLPLVLGPDRAKLSKRHGATSVKEFRDLGYYPEALCNFIALLGFNPGTDENEYGDLFALEELISRFDLSRMQRAGAVWNQGKLAWINQQYGRRELAEERRTKHLPPLRNPELPDVPKELLQRITTVLAEENVTHALSDTGLTELILVAMERTPLETLPQELLKEYRYCFSAPKPDAELLSWKGMPAKEVTSMLQLAITTLEAILPADWTQATIETALLQQAEKQTNAEGKADRGRLLWPVRVALSGAKKSPSPFDLAVILGRDETLARLNRAAKL
jgi:glutamyl-tRNA synthetase